VRMQQDPLTPLVYEIVESTTPQTTVADVVVGALGVVGAIGAIAFVLGVFFAGVLLLLRKWRGEDEVNAEGSGAVRLRLNSNNQ